VGERSPARTLINTLINNARELQVRLKKKKRRDLEMREQSRKRRGFEKAKKWKSPLACLICQPAAASWAVTSSSMAEARRSPSSYVSDPLDGSSSSSSVIRSVRSDSAFVSDVIVSSYGEMTSSNSEPGWLSSFTGRGSPASASVVDSFGSVLGY
jgi:hypothetical protein